MPEHSLPGRLTDPVARVHHAGGCKGVALMPLNLRASFKSAKQRTPWHISNEVLYDLCRKHPLHEERQVVLAKILLIGRAYAAAIERRKSYRNESNEDFYVRRVAPTIIRSPIDRWIEQAKRQKPGTAEALEVMIDIHGRTRCSPAGRHGNAWPQPNQHHHEHLLARNAGARRRSSRENARGDVHQDWGQKWGQIGLTE